MKRSDVFVADEPGATVDETEHKLRILIIGGTRFIGRHIAERAFADGHEITLFHRGRFAADIFPQAEHRLGDRNADLHLLGSGSWDATIDMCAYFPRHVHALADVLGDRGGRYTFVSSVSAYGVPVAKGFDEDSPVVKLSDPTTEILTDSTYGGLKALGEQAAIERFGPGSLVVRPTYVVGSHDFSWRFPWWVTRLARGGEVLAPGPADDPCQIIDARDLAAWILSMNERGLSGIFHAVGPAVPITWKTLLKTIAAEVAPRETSLSWVDRDFLVSHGITDVDLPLWPGVEPDPAMLTANPAKALNAGLKLRPLEETISDTFVWARTYQPGDGSTLTVERETELLAMWKVLLNEK